MCLITSHLRGRTPANKHMSNSEPNHLRGSALEKLHARDVWSRGEVAHSAGLFGLLVQSFSSEPPVWTPDTPKRVTASMWQGEWPERAQELAPHTMPCPLLT